MNRLKTRVAICYDFDGTLIRGNMQENGFIPRIGMRKEDFWREVKEQAKRHDMDEVLAYMHLMLRKAEEKRVEFNRQSLAAQGAGVEFFPGVEGWFDLIGKHRDEEVEIRHYVISSGLDEMIRSTSSTGSCRRKKGRFRLNA